VLDLGIEEVPLPITRTLALVHRIGTTTLIVLAVAGCSSASPLRIKNDTGSSVTLVS